jgi:hypothetical protein
MPTLTLSPGAGALAPEPGAVALEPSVAGQGTALLVDADASVLASGGRPAEWLTFALPHGVRVDGKARAPRCTRAQAAKAACPPSTAIGSGRFIVTVRDFAAWGGQAQLAWSLAASLGTPVRRGDAASVVLTGKLLAADSVTAFLGPALGPDVPRTVSVVARLVRRRSGAYGAELRLPRLPVELGVRPPVTATPARLELALSGVRRTREDVVHRVKVTTLDGTEIRKVKDHRLIGHHLLRTPRTCRGSWASEVRAGFPAGVRRTVSRIACG